MSTTPTTPPSYRTQLLHIADVAAKDYSDLPEAVIRSYGTARFYQLMLTASLVARPPDCPRGNRNMRFVRLHKGRINVRFGPEHVYIPNNDKGICRLVANCLKFDSILCSFVHMQTARLLVGTDGAIMDESMPITIFLHEPPDWLRDGDDSWARLEEAGAEIDRLAETNEVNSETLHFAMQRQVLREMLDRYEPKG